MGVPILEKKSAKVVQIQAKQAINKAGLLGEKSQVKGVVDVSGSMENPNRFYSSGIVDGLVTRVLGVGLNMDDNGSVEMIALDSGARELEAVTAQNLDGYVPTKLQRLVGGGTNYAPSIEKVLETTEPGDPALVLVFTDGQNFDEAQAKQALIKASQYPIFFQFFGIHNLGREMTKQEAERAFPFLASVDTMSGRQIDNAGFESLSLTTVTDEELYAKILKEYPQFLQAARAAGMLPWDPSNDPRLGNGGGSGGGKKKGFWNR